MLFIISTLISAIITYLLISTYFLQITQNEIKSDVKCEFSFVHISDIHGTLRFINGKLYNAINKLSPDFVVITGDLASNRKQLPKVLNHLCNIKASKGIFIILGNYEGQEIKGLSKKNIDINDSIKLISENNNFTLLVNEHCLFDVNGNQVLIYGFDNSTYGKEKYDNSIDGLKYDYKLLLAHSPNIIKVIDALNIASNQVLVGHTHGGQINILNNKHLREYKEFHTGVKSHNSTFFCINRGLGTVKIPFRVNSYPEISLYRIKRR